MPPLPNRNIPSANTDVLMNNFMDKYINQNGVPKYQYNDILERKR